MEAHEGKRGNSDPVGEAILSDSKELHLKEGSSRAAAS